MFFLNFIFKGEVEIIELRHSRQGQTAAIGQRALRSRNGCIDDRGRKVPRSTSEF